ncbi:Alpha/Beta hydrolase protein [Zopfochytrium polystomum]|nr:Alpha/Beta hydrolase protein [Zopfochytrium polystomum]
MAHNNDHRFVARDDDEGDVALFELRIPDAAVADLQRRLDAARLPDPLVDHDDDTPYPPTFGGGRGFAQGIPRKDLGLLLDRWKAHARDWRSQEARLNDLPQYAVRLPPGTGGGGPAGGMVHFLHRRSPRRDAVPLLLVHGWPGSCYDFHKVLDPLADPPSSESHLPAAFHVVAPSIPGSGFSDPLPDAPRLTAAAVAKTFATLMRTLGYDRFVVQGGDWGAAVVRELAAMEGERCVAVHLNFAPVPAPPTLASALTRLRVLLSPAADNGKNNNNNEDNENDLTALRFLRSWSAHESGYYKIQATKPYTLGVALNDSPVGLLAWVAEKMWPALGFDEALVDDILTTVSVYWFTESIASSFRLYKDERNRINNVRIKQPTAVAIYPREIVRLPKAWLQYRFNLVRFNKMPRGGHFPALEVPAAFVDDLRGFAADLKRLRVVPGAGPTNRATDAKEEESRGAKANGAQAKKGRRAKL